MTGPSHPASCREGASATDAWRLVERLAPALRIAHQIPGRIRLKLVGAVPVPLGPGQRLDAALNGIRGIHGVQLNLLARSCVVAYDAAVIPDAAWPDLLGGRATPAAAALAAVLRERCAAAGDA